MPFIINEEICTKCHKYKFTKFKSFVSQMHYSLTTVLLLCIIHSLQTVTTYLVIFGL